MTEVIQAPNYYKELPTALGGTVLGTFMPENQSLTDYYTEELHLLGNRLHERFPEIVGLTVFGSTARGEAVQKENGQHSDVDAYIVLDADVQPALASIAHIEDDGSVSSSMSGKGIDIRLGVADLISEITGIDESHDMRICVVSEYLTKIKPQELLAEVQEPPEPVTDWEALDEASKKVLRYFTSADGVRGIFHKSAYGDLRKYQAWVVETLAEFHDEKPQITERIWTGIRFMVDHFEKGRDSEALYHSRLPETLADAVAYYTKSGGAHQPGNNV